MALMILKMTAVTALYVLLTVLLWKGIGGRKINWPKRLLVGLVYGLCSVLSNHFAIDFGDMLLNVRDIGPLAAGLFFDPVSGIIAGLIGGIERYIAGTYWNIGSYTRVACSVSTCLAGFLAAGLHIRLFKRTRPSAIYAFFMGAVMEVFHMYVVLITHREDMTMALYVVKICSPPMIVFTGIGLAAASEALRILEGDWQNPFRHVPKEEVPLARTFRFWLFIVTTLVLVVNLFSAYAFQTQAAVQEARNELVQIAGDIQTAVEKNREEDGNIDLVADTLEIFRAGGSESVDIVDADGNITAGMHKGQTLPEPLETYRGLLHEEGFFRAEIFGETVMGRLDDLGDGLTLVTLLQASDIYSSRDAQTYETAFADILLFTVIYILISWLVQEIVVRNLSMVNVSLGKITGGDLNETVSVRESSEFASLSDDINETVDALKGYIDAAKKRIEQELELARTIQDSALPKNFAFPRNEFEIYATMDPAKEVGGDFYDFFFVDQHKFALVIADVSGKGIPAALFMMRAKASIRSLAESGIGVSEILYRANNILCEGNDAEMFVTVWIGVIDLETGTMHCASAGHEYPMLMRAGGQFELLKDRHGLALAAMGDMRYREYDLQFSPGDKLFVYTDGIPEAIDSQTQQYGTDRLLHALNAVNTEKMETILPAIRKNLADFEGGTDQFDDITMLGFVFFGSAQEDGQAETGSLPEKNPPGTE